MSEHYTKVQQIAIDAYMAKLNTPEVQTEVARVHEAIEKAAAQGEFHCKLLVKVSTQDARYVCQVLTNEGYRVMSCLGEGVFEITWNGK
jgi:hypothetical protein